MNKLTKRKLAEKIVDVLESNNEDSCEEDNVDNEAEESDTSDDTDADDGRISWWGKSDLF